MNRNQRKYLSHQSPQTTETGHSCTSSSLELPRARQGAGLGAQDAGTASGLGHFQTPRASQMRTAVPFLPGLQEKWNEQEFLLEFHKGHRDSGPELPCVKSMHSP